MLARLCVAPEIIVAFSFHSMKNNFFPVLAHVLTCYFLLYVYVDLDRLYQPGLKVFLQVSNGQVNSEAHP